MWELSVPRQWQPSEPYALVLFTDNRPSPNHSIRYTIKDPPEPVRFLFPSTNPQPYEELIAGVTYLRSTHPPFVSLFILQFQAQYMETHPVCPSLPALCRYVDQEIGQNNQISTVNDMLMILGTLKLPKITRNVQFHSVFVILETIKYHSISDFIDTSELKTTVLKGIAHILTIDCVLQGNEWRNIVKRLENERDLIELIAEREEISGNSAEFLWEESGRHSDSFQLKVVLTSIRHSQDLPTLFQALKLLSTLPFPRSSWDKALFTRLNAYFSEQISIRTEDVKYIVSHSEGMTSEDEKLVGSALGRRVMEAKYEDLEEEEVDLVLRCRGVYPVTQRVEVFRRVVRHRKYCVSRGVRLLGEEDSAGVVSVWREWVKGVMRLATEELITVVDRTLSAITDSPLYPTLSNLSMSEIHQHCPSLASFLRLSDCIVACATLRPVYSDYLHTLLSDSPVSILHEVLSFSITRYESVVDTGNTAVWEVYIRMCTAATDRLPNISEQEVLSSVFNCAWPASWPLLVRYRRHFDHRSAYVRSITSGIASISKEISTFTCTFRSLIRLNQLNDTQKSRFIRLLQEISENKDEIRESFQKSLLVLGEMLGIFEEIYAFIAEILDIYPWADAVTAIISDFVAKFSHMTVKSLQVPLEIHTLNETAQQTKAFFSSRLYKMYLKQTNLKQNEMEYVTYVSKLCANAVLTLSTALQGIQKQGPQAQLVSLVSLFEECSGEEIQRELEVLGRALPWEGYGEWQKTLELYGREKELQAHCKLLASLRRLELMQDTDVRTACEEYLQLLTDSGYLYSDNYGEETQSTSSSSRPHLTDYFHLPSLDLATYTSHCTHIRSVLYTTPQAESCLNVLLELYKNRELLTFLSSVTDTTLTHLKESVNDYDEIAVTVDLIGDLEAAWAVRERIKQGSHSYPELLHRVRQIRDEGDVETLYAQVRGCQAHLNELKWLLREVDSKGEVRMSQIESICQDSRITFQPEADYEVSIEYAVGALLVIDRSHGWKTLSLPVFSELEQRAMLVHSHSPTSLLHSFLEIAHYVRLIQHKLTALQSLGYPLSTVPAFDIHSGDSHELSEYAAHLKSTLTHYQAGLIHLYETAPVLTYFYGHQFWAIERHLMGLHDSHYDTISLLAYNEMTVLHDHFHPAFLPNEPLDRLKCLANALQFSPTPPKPPLSLSIPSEFHISPDSTFIYIQSECTLQGLLSVYVQSQANLPKPYHLLLGRTDTLWEEIQAFLYRCSGDPSKPLYVFLGLHKLPLKLQMKTKKTLDRIISSGKSAFRLAFISETDMESSVIGEYISSCIWLHTQHLTSTQLIPDKASLTALLLNINSDFYVIKSDLPGVGKTTYVRKQAEMHRRGLNYVSLSGDLSSEFLYKSLGKEQSTGLHIRLSAVESTELVNEFLLSLCLTQAWTWGDRRVHLPLTIIYLELANLQPDNVLSSVPLVRFLPGIEVNFRADEVKLQSNELFHLCTFLQLIDTQKVDTMERHDVKLPENVGVLLEKFYFRPMQAVGQVVSYRSLSAFAEVFVHLAGQIDTGPLSIPSITAALSDISAKSTLRTRLNGIRMEAMKCTLQTALEATSTSISKVHKQQLEAMGIPLPALYNRPDFTEKEHFVMVFMEDGAIVPIYRDVKEVPLAYRTLLTAQTVLLEKEHVRRTRTRPPDLPDYRQMTDSELKSLLFNIFPSPTAPPDPVLSSFVMTADTFYKMLLIYLRATSLQPVVIMGETGCGKTFLVRYFVKAVLGVKLLIFNIHAGTTNSDLDAMMDKIRVEAERSEENVWVFLDEFNTSKCVGRICDMLCDREDRGRKLRGNVRLVVACNPLRKRGEAYQGNVGLQRELGGRREAYMVQPLPDNILQYIWDFGCLSAPDTKAYITAMLQSEPHLVPYVPLLYTAHMYYRDKGDYVSASLRDISRFIKLYRWFSDTLPKRINSARNADKLMQVPPFSVSTISVMLAFGIAYYVRLHWTRPEFLSYVFPHHSPLLTSTDFLACLQWDQTDFLSRVHCIPKGIALNTALTENLTTLFHCVYNHIPVFLCGKPGCSKTLSTRILLSACRGPLSSDEFLQELPELVLRSFQGSPSCTSAAIFDLFQRAEKYLLSEKALLPVIVFDEIALAEQSQENPLKALHSLLEAEEVKIGFIALSNWKLDAAKMNRVLYLARPDPDLEDLERTALCLVGDLGRNIPDGYLNVLKSIAKAYFLCQVEGKKEWQMYGLRDFYAIIREVAGQIRDNRNRLTQKFLFEAILFSVERNFACETAIKSLFIEKFSSISSFNREIISFSDQISLFSLIKANLSDDLSRYLLLIGDLGTVISLLPSSYQFLLGSPLSNDYQSEEYIQRKLTEVILCMEREVCVVLLGMEQSYGALYDLFNQNFVYSKDLERRYCRVALGRRTHPRCKVSKGFRVVVGMETQDLQTAEPPFLNRFEKQRIELSALLTAEQKETLARLKEWIQTLFSLRNGKKVRLSLTSVFPLHGSEEALMRLVYSCADFQQAQSVLISSSSEDLLLLSSLCQSSLDLWPASHSARDLLFPSAACVVLTQTDTNFSNPYLQLAHFHVFKSEQEILHSLQRFEDGPKQVYAMEISLTEFASELLWLQSILQKTKKKVRIIGRYSRNQSDWFPIKVLPAWEVRYIGHYASPTDLTLSNSDLYQRITSALDTNLPVLTSKAYENVLFTGDYLPSIDITSHIAHMEAAFRLDNGLFPHIKSLITRLLHETQHSDWREEVLCDPSIVNRCKTLPAAINELQLVWLEAKLTAFLVTLERHRAAESAYLSGNREDIKEIWVQGVNDMQIDGSYSVTTCSVPVDIKPRLFIPFIMRDWDLFQRKFQLLRREDASELYEFASFMQSKSIIPIHLQTVDTLAELYIEDILQLLCEDLSIPKSYFNFVKASGKSLICVSEAIWTRVYQVLRTYKQLEMLVQVGRCWASLRKAELVEWVTVEMQGNSGVEVLARTVETGSLQVVSPAALEEWLSGTQASFLSHLHSLFLTLQALQNVYSFPFTKLSVIYFWLHFLPTAVQFRLSLSVLTALITQGKGLDTDTRPYVYHPQFQQLLFSVLKPLNPDNERVLWSFRLKYYTMLLNQDVECMTQVVDCLKTQSEFVPCAGLIATILQITHLEDCEAVLRAITTGKEEFTAVQCRLNSLLMYPFEVYISDAIYMKLTDRDSKDYLTRYRDEFRYAIHNLSVASLWPRLRKVLLMSGIRLYVEHYCSAVHVGNVQTIDTEVMTEAAKLPELRDVLALYCVKYLRRLKPGVSCRNFHQSFLTHRPPWLASFHYPSQKLLRVPLLPLISDSFPAIYLQLHSSVLYFRPFPSHFLSTSEGKLALLIAVFLLSRQEDTKLALENWLSSCLHCIPHKSLHLTASFISNKRFLELNEDQSDSLYLFFCFVIAYSSVENPFSRLLFDENGEVWSDFGAKFASVYKYGAESSPEFAYLHHFIRELNKIPGSSDNPVVIQCPNCTIMQIKTKSGNYYCKKCGCSFSHTIFTRFITKKEGLEQAERLLKRCKEREAAVYVVQSERGVEREALPGRDLQDEKAFRLLHLWLNGSLAAGVGMQLVGETQLRQGLCFTTGGLDLPQYFSRTLRSDFSALEALQVSSLWVEALISLLPAFVTGHNFACTTREQRITFEHAFERQLITQSQPNIETYQQNCQFALYDWEFYIEEIGKIPKIDNIGLFRCRVEGSFEEIEDKYAEIEGKFPFLELFLRKKQSFDQLKCLFPLIKFIKSLKNRYNYQISQKEAKDLKLEAALLCENWLLEQFSELKEQWNLYLAGLPLLHEGHELKIREIDEKHDILDWYLDSKSTEGKELLAVIFHLIALQNGILAEWNVTTESTSVLQVAQTHLVTVNLAEKREFRRYWMNEAGYGKGEKAVYDWEAMETYVKSRVLKGCRLHFVPAPSHYQFSFSFISDAFPIIASNIPQEPLTSNYMTDLARLYPHKAPSESENLSKALGSVSSLLSQIVYFRCLPSDALSSLASKITDFDRVSAAISPLLHIEITHIVALFEYIEKRCFEFVEKFIPTECNISLSDRDKKTFSRLKLMENVEEIKNALKKVVMRVCLNANNADLELKSVLFREEFWEKGVINEGNRREIERVIGDLQVKMCYGVYRSLLEEESREERKSLSAGKTVVKKVRGPKQHF